MVEVQKYHEQVQSKVEKQKSPAEVKAWIEKQTKKIADTPIWKKVWETIKSETWAKKAWEKLKAILFLKENISEKQSRSEMLKKLDWKIEKTLPKWQSIDKIAKILKKPDWS